MRKGLAEKQEEIRAKMRRKRQRMERKKDSANPPNRKRRSGKCLFKEIGSKCRCTICVKMDNESRSWCRYARQRVNRIQSEVAAERMISLCHPKSSWLSVMEAWKYTQPTTQEGKPTTPQNMKASFGMFPDEVCNRSRLSWRLMAPPDDKQTQ